MKIIGMDEHGHYIATISSDEVNKVLANTADYYSKPKLRVGTEIDLAIGYKYVNDLKSVCNDFETSYRKFISVSNSMAKFINTIKGSNNDEPDL